MNLVWEATNYRAVDASGNLYVVGANDRNDERRWRWHVSDDIGILLGHGEEDTCEEAMAATVSHMIERAKVPQ